MNCEDFQRIIAGERDEDLSSQDSTAFEAHLEACASCQRAVARAEDDLSKLAGFFETPALTGTAWASVDAAVAAEVRTPKAQPVAPLVTPLVVPILTREPTKTPEAKRLVPAEPSRVLARVRSAQTSGFSLAVVAAAIAIVCGLHDAFNRPPPKGPPSIGRVAPPEPDDVRMVTTKPGDGYQVVSVQSDTLIFIPLK